MQGVSKKNSSFIYTSDGEIKKTHINEDTQRKSLNVIKKEKTLCIEQNLVMTKNSIPFGFVNILNFR